MVRIPRSGCDAALLHEATMRKAPDADPELEGQATLVIGGGSGLGSQTAEAQCDRLGALDDFAQLVVACCENVYFNGKTIRLGGALRLPPR